MRAPNCATGPRDNHHRSGNEEGRSIEESWRRMGAMWLGPLLFVAVSIFLWKYVGAVFMPELLARSIFRVAPGWPVWSCTSRSMLHCFILAATSPSQYFGLH